MIKNEILEPQGNDIHECSIHKCTFLYRILWINACILFGFSFFIFPTNDTYYYWTWSKHLQLSYLDGPPLIAYLLYVSTHIFGDNFFAIELISLLSIYGSTYLIYQIVKEFASKPAALCAAALWIMFPFATTRFIAISMTLDGLEVFFSLLLIYAAFKWIKFQNTWYMYLMGMSAGLAMLAKYNTVILIAGLLLYFMLNKNLRKIYCQFNFYCAILIALLIFSPVLLWNYEHDWVSVIYQLNLHKWNGPKGAINSAEKQGLRGVWFYIGSCVFGVLNIFLLIIAYFRVWKGVKLTASYNNSILVFVAYFILLFWLYQAYFAHVGLNYMVTLSALLSIITGQYLTLHRKYYWVIKCLLIVFSIMSLAMLIDKSRLHASDMANYNKYVKTGLIKRFLI